VSSTVCIGVDWGSSHCRAYRLSAAGEILEKRTSDTGIVKLKEGEHEPALRALIGDWLKTYPDAAVILSGMVGGRGGWREVPYAAIPADPAAILTGCTKLTLGDGRPVHLVPGLRRDGERPDVMRGEEVQILGAAVTGDATVCLPGTHSKWATVKGGKIVDFATYLSGEIFNLLCQHSIVGRLIVEAPFDEAAFLAGADQAKEPGHFLSHAFTARALAVTDRMPASAIRSYLSGLTIGHEIEAAAPPSGASVLLLGNEELCGLYAKLLARKGVTGVPGPAEAATLGHYRIWQALAQ